MSSLTRIILLLLLLLIVGCQMDIEPRPAPTPMPSAVSLPPATPRAAQHSNAQAMPPQVHYVTPKNLITSSDSSSDDLDKLVAHSSLIVIGTVSADEPGILRIQDDTPSDSSSSITNVQSVGNVYEVRVERYLKGGNGAESISVVQFVGLDYQDKGHTKQARSRDDNLLPSQELPLLNPMRKCYTEDSNS